MVNIIKQFYQKKDSHYYYIQINNHIYLINYKHYFDDYDDYFKIESVKLVDMIPNDAKEIEFDEIPVAIQYAFRLFNWKEERHNSTDLDDLIQLYGVMPTIYVYIDEVFIIFGSYPYALVIKNINKKNHYRLILVNKLDLKMMTLVKMNFEIKNLLISLTWIIPYVGYYYPKIRYYTDDIDSYIVSDDNIIKIDYENNKTNIVDINEKLLLSYKRILKIE